jgi:hypothetical protein
LEELGRIVSNTFHGFILILYCGCYDNGGFVLPKTVSVEVGEINSIADIPLIDMFFLLWVLYIPHLSVVKFIGISALPKKSPMTG